MTKRVAILVDQKWRDLPGLVWLKLLIEKEAEVEVRLFPLGSEQAYLPWFRPHVAIFNNFQDKSRIAFGRRLKQQGTKIVVLPTEGIPTLGWQLDDWAGKSSNWADLDLYLAWNPIIMERILTLGSLAAEQVRTIGVPRFDFYGSELRSCAMQKDAYCEKFNLNASCPTILWPTNFTLAGFETRNQELWKSIYKAMHWDRAYPNLAPQDIPRIDGDTRRMTRDALVRLRKDFPDANLAIKPHPNEDVTFWRDFAKRMDAEPGNGRVVLIAGVYIWDALSCAEVVIQRSCTTAPEAWFQGIPSIEARFNMADFYYSCDHASGSEEVASLDALSAVVKDYLYGGRTVPNKQKSAQKKFEEKWCVAVDGHRTRVAVGEIRALLERTPSRIGWPRPHPRLISQYGKATIKKCMGHRPHELLTWDYILRLKKKPEGADILGRIDKYVDPEDILRWENKLRKYLP